MKDEKPEAPAATLDITLDICPMTFVKTKLELEDLSPGAVLEVLLRDGEPLHNVTRSCEEEGHRVVAREEMRPGIWRVQILRGPGA